MNDIFIFLLATTAPTLVDGSLDHDETSSANNRNLISHLSILTFQVIQRDLHFVELTFIYFMQNPDSSPMFITLPSEISFIMLIKSSNEQTSDLCSIGACPISNLPSLYMPHDTTLVFFIDKRTCTCDW